MNNNIMEFNNNKLTFKVGDKIKVYQNITEGNKNRIQIFSGIVISIKKPNHITSTFTVRRFLKGYGVEKIFPVHSPNIEKVIVEIESVIVRAKMFFLRNKKGKKAIQVIPKNKK